MSQWRGQIKNIDEPGDVADFVGDHYYVPTLVVLLGFMLWSRVRDWQSFIVDGTVLFPGNDPWYHYRMVSYTVEHWPATSPFDAWTGFPEGAHSSQFGTVFDQLIATAALIVGLGDPSDHTIRMVMLFAPPVLGTLVAVPTYYIGKRASGRFGGVVAVGVLALTGSELASRSAVGFADHHVAEALFQALAVLTTMIAITVANREKPVYELFVARDVESLRRPVGWAVLSGVAVALYIWTWPPGVFLFGVLGVFYAVELSSSYAHGESPEPVAITGTISMLTAAVLTLAVMEDVGISATSYNVIQPLLALVVAAGCVFMAWLAREWDDRDLGRALYPAAIAGIIAVIAGLTALLLPDLFDFLVSQIERVIGFGRTATAATVGEAQPMTLDQAFTRYRFTLIVAAVGAVFVLARHFYDRPRPEMTLLLVWGAFMLAAAFTQRRFDYYLVVPVAALTGYVVGIFADYADLSAAESDIEAYQVLTILAIFLLVLAPLVYPASIAMTETRSGPGQTPQSWQQSFEWMDSSMPDEGNMGGAGNDMELYDTYERTDDYDYPDGAYGVLSWWDYGHHITAMGERIPVANPFQQNADQAANFLLSTNESHANGVTERLSEGDGAETSHVMVDWKMITTTSRFATANRMINTQGKYFAPFQFYSDGNISESDYYQQIYYETGQQGGVQYRRFFRQKQSYYDSTAVRLYRYHGSAVDPSPVVLDWEFRDVGGQQVPISNGVEQFDNMTAARQFVENDTVSPITGEPTSQVGGFGPFPNESVPALENYRLAHATNSTATADSQRYPLIVRKHVRSLLGFQGQLGTQRGQLAAQQTLGLMERHNSAWVKSFEKVPGATVEGEGPANTTVTASVEMEMPSQNSTFTYSQRAETGPDGEFTTTLPYSTTGYDEWTAEEGYTEPNVKATGPYTFDAGLVVENESLVRKQATANVSEAKVIGEDESSVEVTLESVQQDLGDQTQNGTDESSDNGTSSSESLAPLADGSGASDRSVDSVTAPQPPIQAGVSRSASGGGLP